MKTDKWVRLFGYVFSVVDYTKTIEFYHSVMDSTQRKIQ